MLLAARVRVLISNPGWHRKTMWLFEVREINIGLIFTINLLFTPHFGELTRYVNEWTNGSGILEVFNVAARL